MTNIINFPETEPYVLYDFIFDSFQEAFCHFMPLIDKLEGHTPYNELEHDVKRKVFEQWAQAFLDTAKQVIKDMDGQFISHIGDKP